MHNGRCSGAVHNLSSVAQSVKLHQFAVSLIEMKNDWVYHLFMAKCGCGN